MSCSWSGSSAHDIAGTHNAPITRFSSPCLNLKRWPATPSWDAFTARRKHCGSLTGSCVISAMTPSCWTGIRAVEVAFDSICVSGPEPTERQLARTTRPVPVNGTPGVVSILPDNCFAIHLDSRVLGRLNAELLGVLGVQSLPPELHGFGAGDAADGGSAEK